MENAKNENTSIIGWIPEGATPDSVQFSYGMTRVVYQGRSPYQDIFIFDIPDFGRALMLDGCLQSCEHDTDLYHEPLVHIPALLHGAPKKVLILGAGEGAAAHEVLRWKTVERLLMLDIDQEAVEACREHMKVLHHDSFSNPKVELRFCDAFDYLARAEETWDIVIGDLTDPSDGGLSQKVFSVESFGQMQKLLRPGGLVVMQLGAMMPITTARCAQLLKQAQQVFPWCKLYANYVPSFLSLSGYMLCANEAPPNFALNEEQASALLSENIEGELTCVDGQSLFDMFRIPLFVRQAIQEKAR
ncbi:MAG: methyltransferase domain-containing protein [Myxococcales bacterium]|nr:methyltransferase domain-containing protein [Myxococcales bacterium]MCB9642277.1 methyltransferase domain-containing protein [Myxococcales bacterium]